MHECSVCVFSNASTIACASITTMHACMLIIISYTVYLHMIIVTIVTMFYEHHLPSNINTKSRSAHVHHVSSVGDLA